jgi:hypothetical protein
LQPLNLSVRWPDGRTVNVVLRALPLVGSRVRGADARAALDGRDVATRAALLGLLATATRNLPDQADVELVGFEPAVAKVLRLLDIDGPPPPSIRVDLP